MASWSGDFTGVDWTDVEVLNMFNDAIWERALAVAAYTDSPDSAAETDAGDDVQAASYWSSRQSTIEGMLGNFVRASVTVEGAAVTYPAAAPDDLTYQAIADVFTDLGRPGWMRKRPREISDESQWGDNAENPPVDGQLARHTGNGKIYVNDSGEVWDESDPTFSPDLLTGEIGDERTIGSTSDTTDSRGEPAIDGMRAKLGSTVYEYSSDAGEWVEPDETVDADRVPTGDGVIVGVMAEGDYIGAWILNDLRDVLNLLADAYWGPEVSSGDAKSGSTAGTHYPSIDAAVGVATTAYMSSDSGDTATYAGAFVIQELDAFDDPIGYQSSLTMASGVYKVKTNSHRSRTAQLYGAFSPFEGGGEGPRDTYDKQGQDAASASNTIHGWASVTIAEGTAESEEKTLIADVSSPPPNYAASLPSESGDFAHNKMWTGFSMYSCFAVVSWDFTYGA